MTVSQAKHRIYEGLVTHLYQHELVPGDTFIDIGANVGHHSWQMAQQVGPTGKGFAVEPVPALAERVRNVLAQKDLQNVTVLEKALSDSAGSAEFFFRPSHIGWSSLFEEHVHPEDGASDLEKIQVEVCLVDELFKGLLDNLKFIKLDIEHSEFRAMRGGKTLIKELRPMLVFENSPLLAAKVSGYEPNEFVQFFEQIDYNLYDIEMNPFGEHELHNTRPRDMSTYYVGLPKEHKATGAPKAYFDMDDAVSRLSEKS